MAMKTLVLVFTALLLASSAALRAADAALTAGMAAVEITPDVRMINWVTKKPYEAVRDPVFVRALVLSDGKERVALLAFDLVETREAFTADVRAAITGAVGIPGDHVLLNASHTHSGPYPPIGGETLAPVEQPLMNPELQTDIYREWSAKLPALCVEAAKKADAARQPAALGLARAWAGEVLFNRRPICREGTVKTAMVPANPYALPEAQRFGPVDPTLTWISFRDGAGKPLAALFHLPAHSVAVYGEFTGISADWPGEVTKRLKGALGTEVMFLQGCAGDIVPARRGLKTWSSWVNWSPGGPSPLKQSGLRCPLRRCTPNACRSNCRTTSAGTEKCRPPQNTAKCN
jgi:hypothetical protein